MAPYLGDFIEDATLHFIWTSRATTGASVTRTTDGTIAVWKDNGTTQSVEGVTDIEDFDGFPGVHAVTIDLSANAFYATGADYTVMLTGATIDSVTVNKVLAHFSIENRLGIVASVWNRALTGATHNVSTSAGRRLRTIQVSGGVYNGQVWIDTLGGTAGTVDFENGTADNHVDSITDAKTIATSVGLVDFHVINGSAITLAAETGHESYFGDNWTLALGGQNIHGAHFEGATISGLSTSSDDEVSFDGCEFDNATVELGHFDDCGFSGTLILGKAGDYNFHNCYGKGDTVPIFDKTAGQAIVMKTVAFVGGITISGVQSGDNYELDGNFRVITLNGTSGTVHIHGTYESIVDNRTSSPTLDITGAIKSGDVAAILADTVEIANLPRGGGKKGLS